MAGVKDLMQRYRKWSIGKVTRELKDQMYNFMHFVHNHNPERVKLLEIAMTRFEVCSLQFTQYVSCALRTVS